MYSILLPLSLQAAVTLNSLFTDNMVLQQGMEVPIWGTASAGEQVTVSFDGQEKTTTADGQGGWMVKLDPLTAGGPFVLEVAGENTVSLNNVMAGEVWLCSGQSNMAGNLSGYPYDPAVEAVNMTDVRHTNWNGQWVEATPETAGGFSAAGFFFGRELYRELNVPIGLIKSAVSGTNIEKWLSPASIEKDPGLEPDVVMLGSVPGNLYKSQIEPLIPFAIRGVIWYQGEKNSRDDQDPPDSRFVYADRFQLLVEGWREAWGQGDFSFYAVQLPDFGLLNYDLPETREQQRLGMRTPRTGMVVTIGIGGDLHPRNKLDVGKRLAFWALTHDYGQLDRVFSGPLYESMTVEGSSIRLKFRHFGGELHTVDAALKDFEIAGADSQFVPAEAVIDGDYIVVSNPQVPDPAIARYAWMHEPSVSLINSDGLPASPFRTYGEQLPDTIYGCLDSTYGNYNPNAWIHDQTECATVSLGREGTIQSGGIRMVHNRLNVSFEGSYMIEIRDQAGRKVHSLNGEGNNWFSLENIGSAGMYTVSVKAPDITYIRKIILF